MKDFTAKCFDYLALKTEIAEKLYPAYRAGDRAALTVIAEQLLSALKEKTLAVRGFSSFLRIATPNQFV